MATSEDTKLRWFDLGAESFRRATPPSDRPPTYPCPICLTHFQRDSVVKRILSVEHVPPESLGGRPLLLTCTRCNNVAGSRLDAHAESRERIQAAIGGQADGTERVRALLGDFQVSAEVVTSGGRYELKVSPSVNRPGAMERLRELGKKGAQLTVRYKPYSDLGANISWLRAGYLTLVAKYGYELALDQAFDFVRRQIVEDERALAPTFIAIAPARMPEAFAGVWKVISPDWHRGQAVQFGRRLIQFPSLGDTDFYQRLGQRIGQPTTQTSYQFAGHVKQPTFGSRGGE
jgi:hypothetical protein